MPWAQAYLGWESARAGDVNGDGFDDLVVPDPYQNTTATDAGKAWLYYGSADGLSPTAGWFVEGAASCGQFGCSEAVADFDNDGYADVAAGEPRWTGAGGAEEGRVRVFLGSATGAATSSTWEAQGGQAGARFGWHGSTNAGDWNGDGYADLAVGACSWDDGADADVGGAFVWFGSPSGLDLDVGWTQRGPTTPTSFGLATGDAGDVNGGG